MTRKGVGFLRYAPCGVLVEMTRKGHLRFGRDDNEGVGFLRYAYASVEMTDKFFNNPLSRLSVTAP